MFQISGSSFSLSDGSEILAHISAGQLVIYTNVGKARLVLFAHTVWLISIAWELYLGYNFWV